MGFLEVKQAAGIEGQGNLSAKIMVVADCPDDSSIRAGKPFLGPAGNVFENALHQAKLTKSELFITYLVNNKTTPDSIWNKKKKIALIDLKDHIDRIKQEIESIKPNIIVTIGDLPCYNFTGKDSCYAVRGYLFESPKLGLKVIPTIPPRDFIWSDYIKRYYLAHDLQKAARHSGTKEISYPKFNIEIPKTMADAVAWLDYFKKQKQVCFDIEVLNFNVSCIGFCSNSNLGVSIPISPIWSVEEETEIWRRIASILEDPNIDKIGQNLIFDIQFLWERNKILTRGKIKDTMVEHSIVYPEFLKGLGFLGSIYTDLPFWKDMANFKNIKGEA